ncbi:MAG TPA: alpha/beta fold hydrolase [Pyrinomonadaceae bacterium]|nr:alpha/beta fold hydrolase [Pyrinomonadaceae bacterium]
MKLSMRILITLITLAVLPAGFLTGAQTKAGQAAAQGDSPPRSFLRRCESPDSKAIAWCGKYEVFEDRAAKRGRKIGLNLVILPALAQKHAPDPVFFFAGGPGQGAASLAGYMGEGPLARLRQERDLVFVDQRGTGESNPLICSLFTDDNDLRVYFEDMFPAKEVRACREQLEKIADLKLYTTSIAIEDVDDVRRALGYEKINLYGGSYGTTVALAYLRRYREHVRSVVLAGVAPTDLKLPLPFAKGAQYAIDHLIDDCAADAACHAAFPDLRREFTSVIDRLSKEPVSIELINPVSKKSQRVSLGRGVFAERLRMMLYGLGPASTVPLLIHRAYQGDFKPFVLAVLPQAQGIYQSLSLGMYFSVTCSESVPFISEEEIRKETAGTFLGDYRVRVHQDACREWPRATVPGGFTNAVNSDAPVLLLSGEVDPASPHWLGVEVARHLPNSLQVTIPQGGHGYFSPCLSNVVAEFMSKGSARGLNTTCVSESRRPPFATTVTEALSGAE